MYYKAGDEMRPITFAGMLMFIGPDMALAFGFYEEGSETILISAGSTEDMIDEMLNFARRLWYPPLDRPGGQNNAA